jgi:hypothetical protein
LRCLCLGKIHSGQYIHMYLWSPYSGTYS